MRVTFAGFAVGAALLATASGCGLEHDFEIRKTLGVDSNGASAVEAVSLRDVAGDAWSERSKIKDVEIRSATATITSVGPDNSAPSGDGQALLRRTADPSDAAIFAQGTGVPIAIGSGLTAENLGPLAGVVKRAIKGDGQIQLEAEGTPTGGARAQFDAEIVIKVHVTFGMF